MMQSIYPWQHTVWQQLIQRREQLPHALLLHGPAGIGKSAFADALIASILCLTPKSDGDACGQCKSCHWLHEGTHPDYKLVTPELQETKASKGKPPKRKQYIVVDQVRALADFINLTSHQHKGRRVVLISPADTLNQAAANALLKMLEEPSGNASFVLVTDQMQRLLPTVLSRCVKVSMALPTQAEAMNWLETQNVDAPDQLLAYYAGAPLLAVQAADNHEQLSVLWKLLAQGPRLMPAELATKLMQPSVEWGVTVLQKWLYDLNAFKQTGRLRYHPALKNTFVRLAEMLDLSALNQLQKNVESLRKQASHPLNHELQLEALLVEYIRIFNAK